MNVWIEPEIEKTEEYIIVHLTSNLVDGTFVDAVLDVSNYITSGFQGGGYINPDGTAHLFIKNVENDDRLENITAYDVIIRMSPQANFNDIHYDYLLNLEFNSERRFC